MLDRKFSSRLFTFIKRKRVGEWMEKGEHMEKSYMKYYHKIRSSFVLSVVPAFLSS